MDEHKSHKELFREINDAKKLVKVDARYYHYKNPANLYKVLHIGITEETEEPCVIYQTLYDDAKTIFVRPVSVWLENVEWNGKTVPRFTEAK